MHFFFVSLLVGLVCSLLTVDSACADLVVRTVALSGAQAPGTPAGANFIGFGAPVLDAAGETAFSGFLQRGGGGVTTANSSGIWSEGSGSLALVARTESQAPGTPAGADFNSLGSLVLNAAGQTAFVGSLQTGSGGVSGANDSGIWSEGSGSLALVAREGSQAPGTPAGTNFSIIFNPVLNAAGQTAFSGFLQTGGGGVTTTNDRGVWSEGSGSLALVAREGSHAPGTPAGANFIAFGAPVLNAAGQTAFFGFLQTGSGGVTNANDAGIWSEGSGSLALVTRESNQAPGTPAGANFSSQFFAPVLNATGHTAFIAGLQTGGGGVTTTNDSGIWSDGAGSLTLVTREGDQSPGTPAGASFSSFGNPVLNAVGKTAFNGALQTGSGGVTITNDTGIWSEGSGSLALVTREGDQAPGALAGVTFSFLDDPVMNAHGAVAFIAALAGSGVSSASDFGLWAQDSSGLLTKVVREGDLFEVAPSTLRTISSINFLTGSGGEDGRGMSFNDQFTLTFGLFFTDGTSGVFTSQLITIVPEARAWLMLALIGGGAMGVTILRRCRHWKTATLTPSGLKKAA